MPYALRHPLPASTTTERETLWTIIDPRLPRAIGGWNGPCPVTKNDPDRGNVIVQVGNREVRVQYLDASHTLYIEALLVREVGSDSTALRTVLAYTSELSAGQPAKILGYLPSKQGHPRMTDDSSRAPQAHLALQYFVKNYFRVASVVIVRFAESMQKLTAVPYADSSTLVYYDTDNNPGFHYYEADGTALNIGAVTGSTHARIIQCLKPSKPTAIFHWDMTMFEELADIPPPGDSAQAAPRAAPATPDGRFSAIDEEPEGEVEAQILETGYMGLRREEELVITIPTDSLYTVPIHTTPDNAVLVSTVSYDMQGHLLMRGHPHRYDIEELYYMPWSPPTRTAVTV